MALFVLRKTILQTRIRGHPVGPGDWCLVGPFVYFYTLCMRTAKALARLPGCAGLPELSLAGSLCDKFHISCAGSNVISDLYTSQVTLTHGVLTCNYHGPSSSAAWNLAEVWKYAIHNSRRWLQRRNLTALIRVQSTLFASAMICLERWKPIQTIDSMQTNAFERYLVPCTV